MTHTSNKQHISATDLADQLAEQRVKVIDVREPMEYAGGHIAGSLNVPLARLPQADLPAGPLVLVSQSGNRSARGVQTLLQRGTAHPISDLEGGLPSWQQAGLPLRRLSNAPLPLMRQVQIAAGSLVLLGLILSNVLAPAWILLTWFVGAGLVFAGVRRLLRHSPPARPDALEQGEALMAIETLFLLTGGGALIGFLLSVLGAGGSILLLPLLVSGAALSTREAVPLSLLVVILLALVNLGPYLRRRQFAPRPALQLGVPALAGSWIGGSWVKAGYVSESMELLVFVGAAVVASWLLTQARLEPASAAAPLPPMRPSSHGRWPPGRRLLLSLPAQGLMVGLLTGIAGVGGGFAIVPALVLLAGLPMPLASGTSLLLIAVNALVAFAALGHWPASSLPLLLPLVLGGAIGALVGQRLAPHLSDRKLRKGFSALLLGSALFTGAEAVKRHQSQDQPQARAQVQVQQVSWG